MNKKRTRNMLRLIGCFAAVMMLIFHVTAASFIPVAEAAASQTVTMDKLQYLKTDTITMSYTGAGGNGKDWVGIYRTGAVPPGAGESLRWSYLKSGDGKVSVNNALAPGKYDALYMLNDGYTIVDRKTFEVVDRVVVNGVTLDQQDIVMTEGESKTLTATVAPANANNTQVSWVSSDPAVVTVTSTGSSASLLIGISPGQATVTAVTYEGNFTASANVTVDPTLRSIVAIAQAKHDAAAEGNEDGLYSAGSKAQFQSTIDAANVVAKDSNATREQVESSKAALVAAMQVFEKMRINTDVNGDGKHSVGDLAFVAGAYVKQQGHESWNEKADINHDGKVDIAELAIVAKASMQ